MNIDFKQIVTLWGLISRFFFQLTAWIFEIPSCWSDDWTGFVPIEPDAVIKFIDFRSHPGTRML